MPCSPYVFIGARGSGENDFTTPGWKDRQVGGLGTAVGELFRSMRYDPNSPYKGRISALALPYEALPVPLPGSDAQYTLDYVPSADTGRVMAQNMVNEVHTKCPTSKLVLSGYSQGAWIMGAVARNATGGVQDAIASVVLFADPNGANKGGTLMSPSGRSDYISGSGVVDSASRDVNTAGGIITLFPFYGTLLEAGLGQLYPIVSGGTYDDIADKVLHLCEPGDGVCDDVVGNVGETSTHHSYAYRGKDVFAQTEDGLPDAGDREYKNFQKIFTDREPDDGAGNEWRSDWSIWQDTRVREWLGRQA